MIGLLRAPIRTALCLGAIGLPSGPTLAVAAGLPPPVCSMGMIKGEWALIYQIGTHAGETLGCHVSISAGGAFHSLTCAMGGPEITLTANPTGSLLIDTKCHITGNLSLTTTCPSCMPINYTITNVDALLSRDASRIQGYTIGRYVAAGHTFQIQNPIKLISRSPAGQGPK
jgi:hypothetical protein